MTLDLAALAAEFPREAISWRAQNVTRDGTKAMALAYIDARDVMDRLDAVVGAANWQDRYEVHGPKTICYLSLRIDGEWITKADGAGDSDVEAEKGAISDALKRAAVRWGIGRYLYALPAPWVPCESYQKNDKFYWTKWLGNPWDYVKAVPHTLVKDQRVIDGELREEIDACATVADLELLWKSALFQTEYRKLGEKWQSSLVQHFKETKAALVSTPPRVPANFDKLGART